MVLVPQFYSVMKFKNKHKNHQKTNSPRNKSPLRKLSRDDDQIPSQIKSPIFQEFQQLEKLDEEKTTVATLTTREVQAIQAVKSPIFDVPRDLNSDIPERDRGHLDASDLNLGDFNNDKNSDPIEQNEYEDNPAKGDDPSDFGDANGDLSPTEIRKGKGQNWENIKVESDEELLQFTRNKNFFELPNPGFIYHNKLPKCGSTTMHAILGVLARWNNFRYLKLEPSLVKFFDGEKMSKLINTLLERKKVEKPFFIFKHHYFFNASAYGLETPTWINVIRDPLTWFESNFYFKRFGWERQPGSRRREDQDLTIDQCVAKNHEDCRRVKWKYNQFLCGNAPVCTGHSEAEKKKASEIAKLNIAKNFYLVGILEQFIDTLHLFEKVMPKYYDRAIEALNSEGVQHTINMTKTQHKTPMSEESRHYFRTGPLRYESDVYEFAKKIFNERLEQANIEKYVKPT